MLSGFDVGSGLDVSSKQIHIVGSHGPHYSTRKGVKLLRINAVFRRADVGPVTVAFDIV